MLDAARVTLALVLAAAALGKLRSPRTVVGVWGPLPAALAVTAELGSASWLASGLRPRLALALVAVLFAGFAAILGAIRVRGRARLACACFGGRRERPTMLLALRAAALAALAGALAWRPPLPSAVAMLALGLVTCLVALAGVGVLIASLYRQVGVLLLRVGPRTPLELAHEGPPLGVEAPPLAGLAAAGAALVAFLGEGCRVCRSLEPGLRALDGDDLTVLVVHDVEAGAALERWLVPGTPFLVHVVDGVVRAKGLANTLEEVEAMIAAGSGRSLHAALA